MKMSFRFLITCLAISIRSFANAQIDSVQVNKGIYFTFESLSANKPDVLLSWLTPTTINDLSTTENTLRLNCVNYLSYYDENENILKVPASKILLMADGVDLFISHEISLKHCFEKLLTFGRLSRFFTRKDREGQLNYYSYSPPTVKVKEFVVDLSTGKIYNMNSERGKVRSIIKEDPRFADEKISSDNIDYYINQFNKLNPIISN